MLPRFMWPKVCFVHSKIHFWSHNKFVSTKFVQVCCTVILMLPRPLSCLQDGTHKFFVIARAVQWLFQNSVLPYEWLSCTPAVVSKYINGGICLTIIISCTRGITIEILLFLFNLIINIAQTNSFILSHRLCSHTGFAVYF